VFDNGGFPNITGRRNRKVQPFYLKEVGKRRHVVENFFVRIKRFRRVCTRYDRLAETYLSFVFLAALMDWLR
jgi:transposase